MRPRGVYAINEIVSTDGTKSFMVTGTKPDGTRPRPVFKTELEALAEKQLWERESMDDSSPKGVISYVLSASQLRDAERAILRLDHGTLEAAAKYYSENHVAVTENKTLAEAYPLFLDSKQHLRKNSLREYEYDLKMLIDAHPRRIMNDITKDQLKTFLGSSRPIQGHPYIDRPWSPSRQKYLLKVISPFFSWGVDEGYCGSNPVHKVKVTQTLHTESEPAVLGLQQLQSLLDVSWAYLGGKHAAYVVLATWAAIRPNEVRCLDGSNLNLDEGWAKLSGAVAKTRRRRVVRLMPNALLMLQVLRDSGLLTPESLAPSPKDWTSIRALAGLAGSKDDVPDWCFLRSEERSRRVHRSIDLQAPCTREELAEFVKDVLRHTGISHHLAWFNDENLTAVWAGNSPAIIHKHYKGLVTIRESQGFWAMLPTVLKLAGKQAALPDDGRLRHN